MERHRIGIVIPALNEADTIRRVVDGAQSIGVPIVVDDHSGDDTAAQARAGGATVISHSQTRGYDGALNSGFLHARQIDCEYVITMDADGQHDSTTLHAFISELDRGADLVVGIRDRRQRLAEQIFALVGRLRWSISDPLCGIKGYRRSVYDELGHFDSYQSIGTELALFAASRGLRIAQLAVPTRARAGQTRFGGGFSANRRILRSLCIGLRRY